MLQHDASSDAAAVYQRGVGARLRQALPSGHRQRLTALSAEDRAALGIWAAAHVALLVLAWASAWAFRSTHAHAPLTGAFEHWDAYLLRNIAEYGYFGPHSIPDNIAFFPGYPVVLSMAHLIVRNWTLAELLVPAVAGCFAVVSLTRLAGGRRATLCLVTAPAAIFLMVGYSEALFLALAVPAWHAAIRGRWWRAALLAGLAGLVRPDALFLIPALAVMALTGSYRPHEPPGPGGQLDLAADSLPADGGPRVPFRLRLAGAAAACTALAGPAAYEVYLRVHTGSWMAWSHAQQTGWDMHLTTPAQALRTTWWAAFRHAFSASVAFEFQLELGAMAVMLVAALAFAAAKRWPEAVYCGLAVVALGTGTWYMAASRTLLVLFPVWVALAGLGERRRGIRYAYLAISAPIAVVLGMLYLAGMWAG
jgi:Mannosyltransferase (PIG-V)